MTREEAIYCMKTYLPERYGATEVCPKCKYYNDCKSGEAHDMAIEAIKLSEKYKKAFEDIKEELYKERTNISFNLSEEKAKWTNSGIYDGLVWAEEIMDKHNPDKVGKERE